MGYAVFHRDEAGTPTVEDVSSLEAALEIVERSRNGDGPRDVRVFREVPIEVRTYYKVQVAEDADASAVPGAAAVPTGPEAPAEDVEPVAEPVAEDAVEVAEPTPAEVEVPSEVVAELTVPAATAEVPAVDAGVTAVSDEPYDVRRLLEPAADGDRPTPPPAPLPGAFPLAGPAVQHPTVEVHAANLEDEDGPTKRHSLFGRGG